MDTSNPAGTPKVTDMTPRPSADASPAAKVAQDLDHTKADFARDLAKVSQRNV